jgi:hypothetical protein
LVKCFSMNKLVKILILQLILYTFFGFSSNGEPVQVIRGRVFDNSTYTPLEGASVTLSGKAPLIGTITGESGSFKLENIAAGRYSVTVSHVGYHEQVIHNVLLNAGKELVLEIGLTGKVNPLSEVTVKAEQQAGDDPAEVNYLSSKTITVDEALRYAATFYDPARVVTATPGIMAVNDQANHLVVRGNNPNGILWKIEGADVVNPNHLVNAGTFTDKPSLTGGGVAILNLQLLADSRFLSGAFAAGYGNALAGVFDIHLRKGNNQKYEFTAQASLLGLDFAAEGPLFKNYKGSFLVNYRYSTLGLFERAGIPIGDETINFQDLSFNLSLPAGNAGDFTLFGFGGKSITLFSGVRDSLEWAYEKDRTDVNFFSDAGVLGLSHKIKINTSSGVHSAFASSGLKSGRKEDFIASDYRTVFSELDRLLFIKNSFSSYYFLKINNSRLLKAGATINLERFMIENEKAAGEDQTDVIHSGNAHYILFQPYFHLRQNLSANLLLNAGLQFFYSGFNGAFSAEPRISAQWNLNEVSYIKAGYGLHSQMQHPGIYFNSLESNRELSLTKAHHWIAGYTRWLKKDLIFRSEIYFQQLFEVPVSANGADSFSALNYIETVPVRQKLVNRGTGKNYGAELSVEKTLERDIYFILAGSLYNSLYTGSDGVQRSTRYNGTYSGKFTAGKEFEVRGKDESINVYGINLVAVQAGGYRYAPVDDAFGDQMEPADYSEKEIYSEKLNDFFRLDLRFLWRKNKTNYTRTLALDIRNATNRKNAAWYYFDEELKTVVKKYQLGIIPFLSYRIDF